MSEQIAVQRVKAKVTIREAEESLQRAKAELLKEDGDLQALLEESSEGDSKGVEDEQPNQVCPDPTNLS